MYYQKIFFHTYMEMSDNVNYNERDRRNLAEGGMCYVMDEYVDTLYVREER